MFCCKSQAAIEVHDSITLISPASTLQSNSPTKCTDIIPHIILFSETANNSPSRDAYESITPKQLATPPITKNLSISTTNEFIAESHHEGIIHRNLIILDPSDNYEETEDPKPVIAGIPVQEYYDINIARWDERLFSSTPASEHGTYFPVLINQETRELLLYNENQQTWRDHCQKPDWLTIPGIDFLPSEVDNIIAGDGGLLCVNGGTQPRSRNIHTPPIPHAEDYNLHQYPQQSILVVCNPLTHELKFIPRHANKKLDRKVACMQILSNHPPNPLSNPKTTSSSDTRPPPKTRYQLHVLGTHYEPPTLHGPGSHELILMTYDSRSDSWIYGTVVGRARVSSFAKTGIACTEDGFYLGGQEETDECTMVKEDVHAKRICTFAHERSGCRSRARRVWVNKIFYVQASSLNWHSVDFRVANVGDCRLIGGSKGLQAPRVVQCRPGGPVYVVTRAKVAPTTIEIYEVVIVGGVPVGEFPLVTKMPKDIYSNLFENEAPLKEYKCTAGCDYICFLVGAPNQSTVGFCDLKKQEWFMSIFPPDPKCLGHYALGDCRWTPDWNARP